MFSKITKSLKSFVKSDLGKVAVGVGASFLLPGIGAGAAASGTSLGGQILGGIKTFAGAAKAGTLGGKEGLLGLKGKIGAAQGAFLNESLQLYSYAESQGRKTT